MERTSIPTRVWRDLHGAELSHAARALFMLLATGPDTSPAGIAPIAEARWSGLLALDVPTVVAGLDELEETGFVVADRQTGEVLVPAFWGWNYAGLHGYRLRDYLDQTVSATVRAAAIGR